MADLITTEDKTKLDKAEEYLNGAKNYVINNDDSFTLAFNLLKKIKIKKNEYDGMRKKLKKPINEAGKAIEDMFRQPINYLTQAEQAYKTSMLRYQEQVDEKQLNNENKYLQELDRLTDESTKALDDHDVTEYCKVMKQIDQLESKSKSLTTNQGLSIRNNWKGKVVDLDLLINAVAQNKAPKGLIKVDEVELNKLAKSTTGVLNIQGIKFYNDKVVSVKT